VWDMREKRTSIKIPSASIEINIREEKRDEILTHKIN
jgi:hypothetical protein